MCIKNWFKKPERKVFSGEVLFECNFKSWEEFSEKFLISDKEFYNKDTIFRKSCVSLCDEGLKIYAHKLSTLDTTWEGRRINNVQSGCIKTWNHEKETFTHVGGTWIVEARFPKTWAALWLLHPDYFVPSINKSHIIPEVDFAENNIGSIDNVVHYGFATDKYSTKGKKGRSHKYDGKFHEYAVEIKEFGYDFYLDGILTNSFRGNDPEFVSFDQPYYLIINNAISTIDVDYSEFIIKSVKFIK